MAAAGKLAPSSRKDAALALLEHDPHAVPNAGSLTLEGAEQNELAARRTLRAQIDKLERELAEAFVTAYPMGGLDPEPARSSAAPRLLGLGELERVRDELAARLRSARSTISERADEQAASRLALEKMLLDPGRHRFVRIANRDIGEPGCGVWFVRPRLGLVGMLMGWWEVKLSSGCPLATAAPGAGWRVGEATLGQ
jgi:hypothetical protein